MHSFVTADMSLRDRIGIDMGDRMPVLEAVEWASEHDVRFLDVTLERRLEDGLEDDASAIRAACASGDVHLGLHPSSAVNMAETAPIVSGATDEYLLAYIDAAQTLGAEWIVVHGGYHFTADVDKRFDASMSRLATAVDRAAEVDVSLLLENHNPEPDRAEVHYIPASPSECHRYFDRFDASRLGWAFNPPHANLHELGIEGFQDELDVARCGEVRLNDNRGDQEEHLPPGDGEIDFAGLFDRLEPHYDGHYTLAFGTPEAMLEGREYLLEVANG